jgi:hypothetical protein
MAILVLGVIQAPDWGWGSTRTFATITSGVVVLAIFVKAERATARPMLDVGLFRNMRFTAASGSITIAFFTLTGFSFLITQYFQFVKTYSPLQTGVRLLPVAIALAVAAISGTKLAVRLGNKAIVATGLALFGLDLFWMAANSASTPYSVLAAQMIVGGGGVGFVTAPATEAIMGAVPAAKAGVGSAINDATRLFGAALGVAVIGSVASSLYRSHLDAKLPQGLSPDAAHAAKGSLGGALVAAQGLAHAGLAATAHALDLVAVDAFLLGYSGSLRAAGAIALAGAVIAAVWLPARPVATPTAAEDADVWVEAIG